MHLSATTAAKSSYMKKITLKNMNSAAKSSQTKHFTIVLQIPTCLINR